MIWITATDLKANQGKYLTLVGREDILVTKNGKEIALITAPQPRDNWVGDLV